MKNVIIIDTIRNENVLERVQAVYSSVMNAHGESTLENKNDDFHYRVFSVPEIITKIIQLNLMNNRVILFCDYHIRIKKFVYILLTFLIRAEIRIAVYSNNKYEVITGRYMKNILTKNILNEITVCVLKVIFGFICMSYLSVIKRRN